MCPIFSQISRSTLPHLSIFRVSFLFSFLFFYYCILFKAVFFLLWFSVCSEFEPLSYLPLIYPFFLLKYLFRFLIFFFLFLLISYTRPRIKCTDERHPTILSQDEELGEVDSRWYAWLTVQGEKFRALLPDLQTTVTRVFATWVWHWTNAGFRSHYLGYKEEQVLQEEMYVGMTEKHKQLKNTMCKNIQTIDR